MAEFGQQSRSSVRFTLAGLLEYVTICAMLSALFHASGSAAIVCLMGMALALGARQGFAALAMFAAALIAADARSVDIKDEGWWREVSVILIGGLLAGWYEFRRRMASRRREASVALQETMLDVK
jgi:hypothetical protein